MTLELTRSQAIDLVAVAAPADAERPARDRQLLRRFLRSTVSVSVSIAVALAAWQLFLVVFHVVPVIGKGPVDVWRYLFTRPGAAAHREVLRKASVTSLGHAMVGLAVGTACALVCALGFALSRTVQATVMPTAMVLRSVPLVAMTPLIAVIFGRDILAITVVAGLITFFPTLVNVSLALRTATRDSMDICHAYGGSRMATLTKVQVPTALPALFASLRIAAPLALVGALVAERLLSGTGLGYLMETSAATYNFNELWSAVVLVTLYSLVLYLGIGALESVVQRSFGQTADH